MVSHAGRTGTVLPAVRPWTERRWRLHRVLMGVSKVPICGDFGWGLGDPPEKPLELALSEAEGAGGWERSLDMVGSGYFLVQGLGGRRSGVAPAQGYVPRLTRSHISATVVPTSSSPDSSAARRRLSKMVWSFTDDGWLGSP